MENCLAQYGKFWVKYAQKCKIYTRHLFECEVQMRKPVGKSVADPSCQPYRMLVTGIPASRIDRRAIARAALAQLVEHRIRNAGVRGSNPLSGTTQFSLSELELSSQSFIKTHEYPLWVSNFGEIIIFRCHVLRIKLLK